VAQSDSPQDPYEGSTPEERQRARAFWDGVLSNLVANLLWTLILVVIATASGWLDPNRGAEAIVGLFVALLLAYMIVLAIWSSGDSDKPRLMMWGLVAIGGFIWLAMVTMSGTLSDLVTGLLSGWERG
jgi:hypothetical protein